LIAEVPEQTPGRSGRPRRSWRAVAFAPPDALLERFTPIALSRGQLRATPRTSRAFSRLGMRRGGANRAPRGLVTSHLGGRKCGRSVAGPPCAQAPRTSRTPGLRLIATQREPLPPAMLPASSRSQKEDFTTAQHRKPR
jgi:hypothetical protein